MIHLRDSSTIQEHSMAHPAREVANLFIKDDDDEPDELNVGEIRTISIRIPEGRLAWLDAMAEHADVSRNVFANELLRVGISSVLGELPDEIREEIEQTVVDNLH
jgi:hypothetical protein